MSIGIRGLPAPSHKIPNGFTVIPSIEPKGYFPYNSSETTSILIELVPKEWLRSRNKRFAVYASELDMVLSMVTVCHSHHFLLQIISLGIGDFIIKGTDDHYSLYNPGINTITIAINKQLVELSSFFIICS